MNNKNTKKKYNNESQTSYVVFPPSLALLPCLSPLMLITHTCWTLVDGYVCIMSPKSVFKSRSASVFTEPARRTPIITQTSEESGTVVVDTAMISSTAAKKTSTVVLFTMEGMELVLNQDTKVLIISVLLWELLLWIQL